MDRALGAVSPEVEALLSAYLMHDAKAAERSREFRKAADLARQVLRDRSIPTLPPLPVVALRQAAQTRRRLVLLRNVASLAACLLIGVGLGAWALRETSVSMPSKSVVWPLVHDKVTIAEADTSESAGFWSLQRLYEQARDRKRSRPLLLKWDSPARKPKLGETT